MELSFIEKTIQLSVELCYDPRSQHLRISEAFHARYTQTSVTGWLDYLLNIWTYTSTIISPVAHILAKIGSKYWSK